MTLYLCKMDPDQTDKRGEPKFIGIIGAIVEVRRSEREVGHQFIPHGCGHKRSRKVWKGAVDCIPKWTERHGYMRLLDHLELTVAQRGF